MILKRICLILIVFIFCVVNVNAYSERRNFRERSNIFCRKLRYCVQLHGEYFFFTLSCLKGLNHMCMHYEEFDDDYRQLMKISDIPNSQPENYLVRFPFYILAERDAIIIFTESAEPDWLVDDVYEIGTNIIYLIIFLHTITMAYVFYSIWRMGK